MYCTFSLGSPVRGRVIFSSIVTIRGGGRFEPEIRDGGTAFPCDLLHFYYWGVGGGTAQRLSPTTDATVSQWHHIIIQWNNCTAVTQLSQNTTIYIDKLIARKHKHALLYMECNIQFLHLYTSGLVYQRHRPMHNQRCISHTKTTSTDKNLWEKNSFPTTSLMAWELSWAKFNVPPSTKHIIGHIGDGFYGSNNPTNSVKALKEDTRLN